MLRHTKNQMMKRHEGLSASPNFSGSGLAKRRRKGGIFQTMHSSNAQEKEVEVVCLDGEERDNSAASVNTLESPSPAITAGRVITSTAVPLKFVNGDCKYFTPACLSILVSFFKQQASSLI
jgi:hypothetical protein